MLEAKSVKKAQTAILNASPANLHSSRLALHLSNDSSSTCLYIASGPDVYTLQIPVEDEDEDHSRVCQGKDGLLVPTLTQVWRWSTVNRCPHRWEIQSVALSQPGNLMLGTVDSYGHVIVSKLDHTDGDDVDRLTYAVSPPDCGVGEPTWAGLSFSPTQFSMAAVARAFCKSVDLYDQDIHVRTLRTLLHPSSLDFVQNLGSGNGASLLAVTEGCQLSIWDLRMKENGGCVRRICGSVGDIYYSVCTSSTANIAVGGADRTVTIYDPRRWSAISRWVHCSKYEITGLSFSSIDPGYIYVQGVDYEVMCKLADDIPFQAFCGDWKACNKLFSFRGDSNWLGFSKCHNRDVLGGWCDSGSVFVANVVPKDVT